MHTISCLGEGRWEGRGEGELVSGLNLNLGFIKETLNRNLIEMFFPPFHALFAIEIMFLDPIFESNFMALQTLKKNIKNTKQYLSNLCSLS